MDDLFTYLPSQFTVVKMLEENPHMSQPQAEHRLIQEKLLHDIETADTFEDLKRPLRFIASNLAMIISKR